MIPIEMWGIFFLFSVTCMQAAVAMPVEVWGIFFFWSSLAVAKGGLVDRAQDLADMSTYPAVKGFFRIEAWILRLDNDQGVEHNGMPCDGPLGKCDPRITAFIDS